MMWEKVDGGLRSFTGTRKFRITKGSDKRWILDECWPDIGAHSQIASVWYVSSAKRIAETLESDARGCK